MEGMDLTALAGLLNFDTKTSEREKPTIRLRPVVRKVLRTHVVAYVLSIAEKHTFSLIGDSFSFIPLLPTAWNDLVKVLKDKSKDTFDFDTIHSLSLDCLQRAVQLCLGVDSTLPRITTLHRSWASCGLYIDSASVINKRRRQEDRWFATADLFNYTIAGASTQLSEHSTETPSVLAVGVFDGHNGPEAAEHCSHLAPYFLSLGLRAHWNKRSFNISDVLANVFYELNLSVNDGRKCHSWLAGTTATICVFHGTTIYTAWVGDSQAWLMYMDEDQVNVRTSNRVGSSTSNSISPHRFENSAPSVTNKSAEVTSACRMQKDSSSDENDDAVAHVASVVCPVVDGFSVALTDCLHRPNSPIEFVSVLRTGGLISTEVAPDDASPTSVTCFSSAAVGKRKSTQFMYHTDKISLQVPPLCDPNLVDCRVGGLCCVSRSLGDDETISGVSPLPSVSMWQHSRKTGKRPLCLIIASDGLWDTEKCSPSDVALHARQWFHDHSHPSGTVEKGLARELSHLAVHNGASDNVTCVIVWMNHWQVDQVDSPVVIETPLFKKNVQWPRGSRTASLVDFHVPNQLITRGPSIHASALTSCRTQRKSMLADDLFRTTVRYSSPPRYVSSGVVSLPSVP